MVCGVLPSRGGRCCGAEGGARPPAAPGRPYCLGGRRPGDVSHSLMCAAVSACRARRTSVSRSIPGGAPSASRRRRAASSVSRFSSVANCLKRSRSCMPCSLSGWRERNPAFSPAKGAEGRAMMHTTINESRRGFPVGCRFFPILVSARGCQRRLWEAVQALLIANNLAGRREARLLMKAA